MKEKEINAGYEIIERFPVGEQGFAIGHSETAPAPYVTWQYRTADPTHYRQIRPAGAGSGTGGSDRKEKEEEAAPRDERGTAGNPEKARQGAVRKKNSREENRRGSGKSGDMFVFIVRNCTRIRKLALRMINELVEKNEVYNAEKIDGKWAQRLRIYYNCGREGK